jgi:hypothetical protein
MNDKTSNNFTDEISALLDFYSDRCTSHASFFVATIFGMFTILSLNSHSNDSSLLAATYWLLVVAGIYFLSKFKFYSDYSEIVKRTLIYPPMTRRIGGLKLSSTRDVFSYIICHVGILWASNKIVYNLFYKRIAGGGKLPHQENEYWRPILRGLLKEEKGRWRNTLTRFFSIILLYFTIAYFPFISIFDPVKDETFLFLGRHWSFNYIVLYSGIVICTIVIKFLSYRSLSQRLYM